MKRWQLFAGGMVAYILIIITTVPATMVDTVLRGASEGRLRLAEAQGTLWSGAGYLEILDAIQHTGVAKNFAWRIQPWSLLRGQVVVEVELDQASTRFPVTISFARIDLAHADINLPAAVLGLGIPALAPLRLTGDALLHIEHLSLGRNRMQGNVTLKWRAAGSALTPVSPLGDYVLQLEADEALVTASLRTLQGLLQLDGKGAWTNGAPPEFIATARISPQFQEPLAPLLRLIAVERGDGRFELRLK